MMIGLKTGSAMRTVAWLAVAAVAACTSDSDPDDAAPDVSVSSSMAQFDSFTYSGMDELFERPLADGHFRNPILAGYYPDPSVVRVGPDFYMVNSTFGFYPGIPVHKSQDLVNWEQIGNVVSRPDMMPFDGLHLGQNGIYAPTIEYNDGTFYVITTCVGCGGNFVVSTSDPAGEWSDPIWLPHIQGIDPSLFFDDDGKLYVVHHGNPEPKLYDAHTALYVMEVDPVTFAAKSDDVMVVDGATKQPWHTEYIEGPHLYKVDGRYILSAPGGGTGYYHGQLAYRSETPFGPFEAYPGNPILTQFGLPDDRADAITATGHADLFDDGNGNWWAVFLATRVYDLDKPPQDPGRFHTGRETFLLPVEWRDGWPIVLEHGVPVPLQPAMPDLPPGTPPTVPTTGNFTLTETFDEPLGPQWLFIRTPTEQWWRLEDGHLVMDARSDRVGSVTQPSFIGRRIQHMKATVETDISFRPSSVDDEAGMLAIQNSGHYLAFGLGLDAEGDKVVRVRQRSGTDMDADGEVLAEVAVPDLTMPLTLRMEIDRGAVSFAYRVDGGENTYVLQDADSAVLTTAKAGGFVGAVVGMYAQSD